MPQPSPAEESRHLVSIWSRAVAPAASVHPTPERDRAPVAGRPPSTMSELAHSGGARTPRTCSTIHARVSVRLGARPPRPTFSSLSAAGIYSGPLSAVIRGASASPKVLQWGTIRRSERAFFRRATCNQRLGRIHRHHWPFGRPLRVTSAGFKPRNLTPACSGLATLAADARR